MDRNDELYKAGLLLHGHKCPAMPMAYISPLTYAQDLMNHAVLGRACSARG